MKKGVNKLFKHIKVQLKDYAASYFTFVCMQNKCPDFIKYCRI